MLLHEVAAAVPTGATGSSVGKLLRRFHLTVPQTLAHRLAGGGLLESRSVAALLAAAAVAGIAGWQVLRRRARRSDRSRPWRWGARTCLVAGAALGLLGLGVGINAYAGYVPNVGAAVALATGRPPSTYAVSGPTTPVPTQAGTSARTAIVGARPVPASIIDNLPLPAPALGMPNGNAYVYLPPGYSAARRYPVLYLLGGAPGAPSDWLYAGSLQATADTLIRGGYLEPFIIVLPRISPSWGIDYEVLNAVHGPQVMTFLTDVVVPAIDAHFPTVATRAGRAIAGFSAGADGAMNVALHHPSLFAAVGGIEPGGSPGARAGWVLADNARLLWQNSAIDYLPYLRFTRPMAFYLSAGSHHSVGPVPVLARELRAKGQVVVVHDESGYGHTWTDARNDLPYLLQFVSTAVGTAARTS